MTTPAKFNSQTTSKGVDQRAAVKSKKVSVYNRPIQEQEVLSTKVGVWWTGELSKYPVIWGKPGLSFKTRFSFRTLHPGVDMKGRRSWQGFYLDLQRHILKSHFSERPDCSNTKSALSKCWKTMNGTLSRNRIFLSFYPKIITSFPFFFLIWH